MEARIAALPAREQLALAFLARAFERILETHGRLAMIALMYVETRCKTQLAAVRNRVTGS
jgi:hypothetical protein